MKGCVVFTRIKTPNSRENRKESESLMKTHTHTTRDSVLCFSSTFKLAWQTRPQLMCMWVYGNAWGLYKQADGLMRSVFLTPMRVSLPLVG